MQRTGVTPAQPLPSDGPCSLQPHRKARERSPCAARSCAQRKRSRAAPNHLPGSGLGPCPAPAAAAAAAASVSLRHSLPRRVGAPGILLLDHRGLEDRYKRRNAKRHRFCLSIYNKINIYILKILIVFSHESLNAKTAGERE